VLSGKSSFLDRWTFIFDVLDLKQDQLLDLDELNTCLASLDASLSGQGGGTPGAVGVMTPTDFGATPQDAGGCHTFLSCLWLRGWSCISSSSSSSSSSSTPGSTPGDVDTPMSPRGPVAMFQGRQVSAHLYLRTFLKAFSSRASLAAGAQSDGFLSKDELAGLLESHPDSAFLLWPFALDFDLMVKTHR
jgi:hypothetical protein